MTHAQKPDLVFQLNGRVHLNWRWRQFSQLLADEFCASAVVMLDTPFFWDSVKGTGYPLHSPVSPSLPLPCVTVCHHFSAGLYYNNRIRKFTDVIFCTGNVWISETQLRHLSLNIHSFHFIPLPRAEWDDSLPFSEAFPIPLCYVLSPPTLLHQPLFHPLSPHLAFYFLLYFSILLFSNSYIIPFWELYFLKFSVHAQTNVIYLTLLSLL